jgi:hypothetical protein
MFTTVNGDGWHLCDVTAPRLCSDVLNCQPVEPTQCRPTSPHC